MLTRLPFYALCATLVALALAPADSAAQVVASERGLVAQTVDGTRITVEYSRPRLRGRSGVFGGLEPWGRTWTPGADDATTLALSKDVEILGRRVAAGRYSVWFTLREHEPWTLVLDPRDSLFHTEHPDSTADQIRIAVRPERVARTEVLTWEFPGISVTGAMLAFRWDTVGVTVPIMVQPTLPLTVTAEEAAPYLGEYDYEWTDPNITDPPSRFRIELRDGRLFGVWSSPQMGSLREMQLLRNGPDRFAYGWFRNGELWATSPELNLTFRRTNGAITHFEYGTAEGTFAKGTRRSQSRGP